MNGILYRLLADRAPFEAATPAATLRQVLEYDPMPPRTYHADAGH